MQRTFNCELDNKNFSSFGTSNLLAQLPKIFKNGKNFGLGTYMVTKKGKNFAMGTFVVTKKGKIFAMGTFVVTKKGKNFAMGTMLGMAQC